MTKNQQWLEVPEAISMAYEFSTEVNEIKFSGGKIDGSTALAAVAANNLLRAYFERMREKVDEGDFDPSEIFDSQLAFNLIEDSDGEEAEIQEE